MFENLYQVIREDLWIAWSKDHQWSRVDRMRQDWLTEVGAAERSTVERAYRDFEADNRPEDSLVTYFANHPGDDPLAAELETPMPVELLALNDPQNWPQPAADNEHEHLWVYGKGGAYCETCNAHLPDQTDPRNWPEPEPSPELKALRRAYQEALAKMRALNELNDFSPVGERAFLEAMRDVDATNARLYFAEQNALKASANLWSKTA